MIDSPVVTKTGVSLPAPAAHRLLLFVLFALRFKLQIRLPI